MRQALERAGAARRSTGGATSGTGTEPGGRAGRLPAGPVAPARAPAARTSAGAGGGGAGPRPPGPPTGAGRSWAGGAGPRPPGPPTGAGRSWAGGPGPGGGGWAGPPDMRRPAMTPRGRRREPGPPWGPPWGPGGRPPGAPGTGAPTATARRKRGRPVRRPHRSGRSWRRRCGHRRPAPRPPKPPKASRKDLPPVRHRRDGSTLLSLLLVLVGLAWLVSRRRPGRLPRGRPRRRPW